MVVMKTYEQMTIVLNTVFSKTLGYNDIVSGIVYFLILLYISMLSPEVPPLVQKIFSNSLFKVFVFTVVMWTAKINPVLAILISVAFLITMNYVNNKPLWEFVDNVSSEMTMPTKEIVVDTSGVVLKTQEDSVAYTIVKSDDGQQTSTEVEPKKQTDEYTGCYQYKTYDITKVKPSSGDDSNFSVLESKE